MSESDSDSSRLASAWAAREHDASAAAACPDPEVLWAFCGAELGPPRHEVIVDHLAVCPSCAEAVRIAIAMGQRPQRARATTGAQRAPKTSWRTAAVAMLAMAAALLLVVARPPDRVGDSDAQIYRGEPISVIVPDMPRTEGLPRDAVRLQWTAGVAGTLYDVQVFDAELLPIAQASGRTDPHYTVAAEALQAVPPGGVLHWQVVVRTPEGREFRTPTWTITIR